MGVKAAVFQSGGQASQHYIPGAYSRIDFQKSAGGLSSINNAVVMGDSRGGEPNTLLWFETAAEAAAVLRSGPLLDALTKAFDPGPGYVPQRIAAWRVNPGLQASKNFTKVSAGVVEVLRLIITHGATGAGNLSIVIAGAAPVLIAVLGTDTTPAQVATKIAAGTFPGWTATVDAGSSDTVLFTAGAVGKHTGANTIDPDATGVTATGGITKKTIGYAAGTYTILDAKAWDWGLHGNQVKVKLEAGTIFGKKLTVGFQSETPFVVDDILKNSIVIQYTGGETACALTVNGTSLFTITTTHTQELNMDLASFPTIQDVVNFINDQPGYACTLATGAQGTDLSTQLDWTAGTAIKAAPVTLTSSVQALVDAMSACPWIGAGNAEYDATDAGRVMPDDIATWSYFTGGTDGAYTTSEWTASLTLLEQEDVQFIGSSATDASVHALIDQHVTDMNSVTGKSERQAILGGASGEAVSAVLTRAKNINNMAVMLTYPEFQDFDASGNVVWWSPAYYAAKLVGMATCVALNEPLTNKQVSVLGFKSISNSDLEKLIQGGVCAGYKNSTGQFVNVRQITTYQGEELQKCEFSMVREALFIVRDLRAAVESTFVGRAMTNGLLTDVDATVNMKLTQYADLGLFNGNPLWWGYKRTVNGDQIIIEFNCNLTPPTNFLFITSHMAVYASLAAA